MTQLFFSDYDIESANEAVLPLVIFGAGGLGREVLLLLQQLNDTHLTWDVRGFYDDQAPATATVAGLRYLGTAADLNATPASEPLAVAVAVGSPTGRARVVAQLTAAHLRFPVLVHPRVHLAPQQRITLGAGSIIQQGCLLTCDIAIGRFVLLNLGCTLGHDAVLEDFCSLMPHANVSGATHLEAGVYLGTSASVIQDVRIGAHAVVGAGAVVVRDLPANVTAVGVPARTIKSDD